MTEICKPCMGKNWCFMLSVVQVQNIEIAQKSCMKTLMILHKRKLHATVQLITYTYTRR